MEYHLVLTTCYLAIGWSSVSSLNVTGLEGETVHINCLPTAGITDKGMYFCKGEKRYSCQDIIPMERGTGTGLDKRFSLDTTGHVVVVQIRKLRGSDSGTYWCGPDRTRRYRDYVQIYLSVGHKEEGRGTTQSLSTPVVAELRPRPPTAPPTAPHDTPVRLILSVCLVTAFVFAVTALMLHRRSGKQSEVAISKEPNKAGSEIAIGDYENNGLDKDNKSIIEMASIYQSLHPNTAQRDAVYQSLDPNTLQHDAIYQSLNPNTLQHDAIYQSLNTNTLQPGGVYQSLNPDQRDSVYQSLNPDQRDSVYQSLKPNTLQQRPVYLNQ
ncbi:uncharacterized protein LOC122128748 [Clupea harengus]|uniref:Uncharacterized protein LOC122128748 n=1 Tax=Clupea harengus TaxID=7950 RepID=A0A8M1K6P0_CLUHA|nr:uncharacterized protein LOC122128748 [Clupea harengus]